MHSRSDIVVVFGDTVVQAAAEDAAWAQTEARSPRVGTPREVVRQPQLLLLKAERKRMAKRATFALVMLENMPPLGWVCPLVLKTERHIVLQQPQQAY